MKRKKGGNQGAKRGQVLFTELNVKILLFRAPTVVLLLLLTIRTVFNA